MTQFSYALIHNSETYEVLFDPNRTSYETRNIYRPNKSKERRFATCNNETEAKLITAALNKWREDGRGWVE